MAGITAAVAPLRHHAERASNLLWEKRLHVATRGVVPVDFPDAGHYATMNYSSIWRTLRALNPTPDDVFVDIGCGRGRVLCCAARMPVRKAIGIDLSSEFCADARRNAAALRGRHAPIEIHECLADEFDYSDCTVAYLFSPFGPETLAKVLAKIRTDRAGAPIRFAYTNAAYPEVFEAQDWLVRTERWPYGSPDVPEHVVDFYASIGTGS
jgi:SAM-dependent methyltransferase